MSRPGWWQRLSVGMRVWLIGMLVGALALVAVLVIAVIVGRSTPERAVARFYQGWSDQDCDAITTYAWSMTPSQCGLWIGMSPPGDVASIRKDRCETRPTGGWTEERMVGRKVCYLKVRFTGDSLTRDVMVIQQNKRWRVFPPGGRWAAAL